MVMMVVINQRSSLVLRNELLRCNRRGYSETKRVLLSSKPPKVHSTQKGVESWYTSRKVTSASLDMGKYNLRRLDYANLNPPVWTVPPHPPTKSVLERLLFPLSIVATGAVVVWAYMNPEEEDMTEYWKRVESGRILWDDDDDDEDEEEEK